MANVIKSVRGAEKNYSTVLNGTLNCRIKFFYADSYLAPILFKQDLILFEIRNIFIYAVIFSVRQMCVSFKSLVFHLRSVCSNLEIPVKILRG